MRKGNFTNLRLIKQTNQGVSAARNHGISIAKNEFIAFLDADDQWLPFFLEEMVSLVHKYPEAGIYTSRYQCVEDGDNFVDAKIWLKDINPEGDLLSNYFEIASKGDLPFMISSTMVHKDLLDKVGGFPVGEKIGEDQDFFVRIAMQGDIAYSPNINLFYHRDSENKVTITNIPSEECPYSQRVHDLVKTSSLTPKTTTDMLRYCAAHLCHLAKLNIHAGKFNIAKSLLSDPRCALKPKHRIGLYGLALVKQVVNTMKWPLMRLFTRPVTQE